MQSEGARIGARIRELRRHSRLTLRDLAASAGIHPNTISNIERGKSRPTPGTLESIASTLGLALDRLVGPEPARPPEGEAVVAFLDGQRAEAPELFADWSDAMWERYLALGRRFGVANDAAARFFADQVKREFRCIRKLLDLFDANQADEVLAVLSREHARLRAGAQRAPVPDTRTDHGHSSILSPHSGSEGAARPERVGVET